MIIDDLHKYGKLTVVLEQDLCIYSKNMNSYSSCFDKNTNSELDVDNIDDSYGLFVYEANDSINVMIPRGARCILTNPIERGYDCTINYKNISCSVSFEDFSDFPIEQLFTITED